MDELSLVASNESVTTYVSIGLEHNSRSINTTAKVSTWVTTTGHDDPAKMEDHSSVLLRATTVGQAVASSCLVAFEELVQGEPNRAAVEAIKTAVNLVAVDLVARLQATQGG